MKTLIVMAAVFAFAGMASAADKTLYKCRAADGSLAFQETPCDGAVLEVIAIAPEKAAATPAVEVTDKSCRDLAQVIWRLDGATATYDISDDAQRELAQRRKGLRERCNLTLDPSPLAVDCALLAEALRLRRNDKDAATDPAHVRITTQHAERCSDAAIAADIERGLR